MKTYGETGNYYTIGHIVMFTGLTDRTVRNYLASGILKGEKINGVWHFTSEQLEAFFCHPSVRSSITARRNGFVYDFLMNPSEKSPRCCMILDYPSEDAKELSEYFCSSICDDNYHDIDFSLDGTKHVTRIILRGDMKEVLRLVNSHINRM